MATRIYYKAICQKCGAVNLVKKPGTITGGIPNSAPRVSGTCKSSKNGNHSPKWTKA